MPFARFPGVDTLLGPEMKSTGEVMGLDKDFGRAFAKSQIGAGLTLPLAGTVFVSVKDADKDDAVEAGAPAGRDGLRHRGHARHGELSAGGGLPVRTVNKVLEGRPHIVDAMKNGEISLVFNTTEGAQSICRFVLHPAHGPADEDPLLHDHCRRRGGDARHRGAQEGSLGVRRCRRRPAILQERRGSPRRELRDVGKAERLFDGANFVHCLVEAVAAELFPLDVLEPFAHFVELCFDIVFFHAGNTIVSSRAA